MSEENKNLDLPNIPAPKKKFPFPKFDMGSILKGLIGDGSMMKEVAKLIEPSLDIFASKMEPGECLFCIPNKEKTKLGIFKGKYVMKTNEIQEVILTGKLDLSSVLNNFDPSKLNPETQKQIEESIANG